MSKETGANITGESNASFGILAVDTDAGMRMRRINFSAGKAIAGAFCFALSLTALNSYAGNYVETNSNASHCFSIASPGVDWSGCDLTHLDLSNAKLANANLRGAKLISTDLREADLSGADLTEAVLGGADLRGANLSDADLSGASMVKAHLAGTNLERARLDGALYNNARKCAPDSAGICR